MGRKPAPPKRTTTTTTTAPRAAVTGRLINLDSTLSQQIHNLTKPFLPRAIFLLLELSADFRLFFPVSVALLLAQIPNSTATLRPFLSPLILGLLLDLALVGLIKVLVRRSRPVYNKDMNVAVSVDHFSFPSGHASRVCFVAYLVHLSAASAIVDILVTFRSNSRFVDRWIAADEVKAVNFLVAVVWGWAVSTSVSRVLLGRHFVSDVFAGSCLGVLEALFAFRFLRI
ncbi:probable lipid phosphate phosphatase beta [Ziziphus jujuba]|uniref:Phosphatidic acid phosphatase type 2/haloperoxidase domain-containing protein n=2 Tax=Ziziphus jujuba TaxID=326968 RepID=A0A978W005_ZIZJJ|nr:probable lipid phosphate phosphatase beta [Ziziphus jujuba]KAH7545289.1 hypothetical protein FEM48_Zijuj01G0077900 [Ziziphus jujuba var. spinosa]